MYEAIIQPETVSTNSGVSLLAVPMLSGRQAEQATPANPNASTPVIGQEAAATNTSPIAISTGSARKISSGGMRAAATATSSRPAVTAAQKTASARLAVADERSRC